jgi:hypothetical protein
MEEDNEDTDTAIRRLGEGKGDTSVKKDSLPPTTTDNTQQKKLLRDIVDEIKQKEREGKDHLETVLEEMKQQQKSKLNLGTAAFRRLWTKVEDLVAEELKYCSEVTDWSEGCDLTWWDSVKVLPLK